MTSLGSIDLRVLGTSLANEILSGRLQAVQPTTDTGYKLYGSGGRLFLPAATNYEAYPDFALDSNGDGLADGYTCAPANCTITKTIVDRTINGRAVKAQRIRIVGGAGVTSSPDILVATNAAAGAFAMDSYATLSVYLKATELSGCSINLALYNRDAAGALLQSWSMASGVATVDPDFVRRAITQQFTHASTSRTNWKVTVANLSEGDVLEFEIAEVLVEKSSILTPTFNGAYDDCAWTGAAHASTSTRTKSDLRGTLSGFGTQGTIAFRFVPLVSSTAAGYQHFFRDAQNGDKFYSFLGSTTFYFGVFIGGGWRTANRSLGAFDANSVHRIVGRWGTGTQDINADGNDGAQGTYPGLPAAPSTWVIGSTAPPASYIGPGLISPYRKSNAWTAAIQANGGAAYSDLAGLARDFMEIGDLLIPLQDSGTAYLKVA